MPSTPRRPEPTFQLLKEIRALHQKLAQITNQLPNIVATQLLKRDNARKMVINGLPENATKAEVRSLLTLGGVSLESVLFSKRVGQERPKGAAPRPLCVELKSASAVPHYKTFAKTLKTSAAFSNCSVRRFETPEERTAGFVLRQERRNSSKPPESLETPPVPINITNPSNMPANQSMDSVEASPEVARTLPIEPLAIFEPTPTTNPQSVPSPGPLRVNRPTSRPTYNFEQRYRPHTPQGYRGPIYSRVITK